MYDAPRDQLGVMDVISKVRMMNKHFAKKGKDLDVSK